MAVATVSSNNHAGDCDLHYPPSSSCNNKIAFSAELSSENDETENSDPAFDFVRTSSDLERWDSDCKDSAPPRSPARGGPISRKRVRTRSLKKRKAVRFGSVELIPRTTKTTSQHDQIQAEQQQQPHDDIVHEQADVWYMKNDLENFRASHTEDAKEMARANKVTDGVLLRTFESCCKGEGKLHPSLAEELRSYLQDCTNDTTRTGLERYAAKKIFHDKTYRRCILLDTVFDVQRRHVLDEERKEEHLRFACEAISFSSVLFAHQLAMASFEQE